MGPALGAATRFGVVGEGQQVSFYSQHPSAQRDPGPSCETCLLGAVLTMVGTWGVETHCSFSLQGRCYFLRSDPPAAEADG